MNEFLSNIASNAIGALIGTGTALLVYILESRRERNIEATKHMAEAKDNVRYFLALMQDASSFSQSQTKLWLEFAAALELDPIRTQLPNSIAASALDRINGLNQEKYFHSFKTAIPEKDILQQFRKLYRSLDFIIKSSALIDSTIEKDLVEVFDIKKSYVIKFSFLIDNTTKLSNHIRFNLYNDNPSYADDALFIATDGLIKDFYNKRTDTTDLTFHQNAFVRPLTENLVLGKFISEPQCLKLALEAKELTHLHSDILFKSEGLVDYVRKFCAAIIDTTQILQAQILSLEARKEIVE